MTRYDLFHSRAHAIKCIIRDKPEAPLMAWALEWNKSYRVIGYIGKAALLHAEAGQLTPPTFRQFNSTDRIRSEIGLEDDADTLFSFDDDL